MNFDPDRYHPKLDRSNLKLNGKKVNAKKNGVVMTCNFCGSFLHLWKDCRDRKEHRETRKFRTYATTEEFDEEGDEQEGEEAYYDDDVTSDSEAFIAHHLKDLGLTRPPSRPGPRIMKNPSLNYYTDANTPLYYCTSLTYDNIQEENKNDMKKRKGENDHEEIVQVPLFSTNRIAGRLAKGRTRNLKSMQRHPIPLISNFGMTKKP